MNEDILYFSKIKNSQLAAKIDILIYDTFKNQSSTWINKGLEHNLDDYISSQNRQYIGIYYNESNLKYETHILHEEHLKDLVIVNIKIKQISLSRLIRLIKNKLLI